MWDRFRITVAGPRRNLTDFPAPGASDVVGGRLPEAGSRCRGGLIVLTPPAIGGPDPPGAYDGWVTTQSSTIRPAAALPRPVREAFSRPLPYVALVFVLTTAGLALDSAGGLAAQNLLGVVVAGFLVMSLVPLSPIERARTLIVIVVATMGEVLGSLIWGAYEYRLSNLPLFVPPGHGIVYLTGLRISEIGFVKRNTRRFVHAAAVAAAAWAVLGLTLLPRADVAGAIGVVFLIVFLLRGRAPAVYAGVFVMVAYLEIYGTWIGTWRWAEELPGTGIANGNPPSGIAAGYVFFDICALALAPIVLALALRARRSWPW